MTNHLPLRQRAAVVAAVLLIFAILAGCAPLENMRGPAVPQEVSDGAALLQKGDAAGAAAKFDAAIKKQSSDVTVYAQIGILCRQFRRWDMEERYAALALQATGKADLHDRAQFYTMLGEARMMQNNMAGAITAYKAVYDLLPDEPLTMNNLGYAYAEAGTNLDEALTLTRKAVETAREQGKDDKEVGTFMDSLGWVQFKKGSYSDAAATLSRAVELAPGEAEIHYHVAMACVKTQRIPEAMVHLERALKMNPQLDAARKELDALRTPPPSSPGSAPAPQ
jgi:Flp pilus assembly protein TadD